MLRLLYTSVSVNSARIFTSKIHVLVRRKKLPVVPVSYREKIRVGRSEIIFFEYFFHGLAVFCWAICSRVPTSILTRDA